MNNELPEIIARVRQFATVPIAVGFGVANRGHFEMVADAGADGVVIGSKIVTTIQNTGEGNIYESVEAFCKQISLTGDASQSGRTSRPSVSRKATPSAGGLPKPVSENVLPARFGEFGGQYVPESLWDCLIELEQAHKSALADPEFIKELKSHYGYINRPSGLYLAENLTKEAGGANIWLKREDLWVQSSFLYGRH
jgi:tryptophan synthase